MKKNSKIQDDIIYLESYQDIKWEFLDMAAEGMS